MRGVWSACAFAAAMLALPSQAMAQIWQGPCRDAPNASDLVTALFGTWAADISVRDGDCTYRGTSVWTLHRIDNGTLHGNRRATISGARPRNCQGPLYNGIEIRPQVSSQGDQCTARLMVTSSYGGYAVARRVEAEISRFDGDTLTIPVPGRPQPIVYRRRRQATPPRVPDPDWNFTCGIAPDAVRYLAITPAIHRQGVTLRIRPMRQPRGPVGSDPMPLACTSDWTVSNPALATLDVQNGTLRIAPHAPPGSEIIVSYNVLGQPVRSMIRVVAADAVVLTGRRGQSAIEGVDACHRIEPVRELEFSSNGRFSVTFTPFESFRDYWGTYRFDPATGRIVMTVEGGNNRPISSDLDGIVRMGEGNRLVFEGMYFGNRREPPPPSGPDDWPPSAPVCRYTFG